MITVADVIALPVFERIELVVPCAGAGERVVTRVGIPEFPASYNEYIEYDSDDFILTTLGFAADNQSMSDDALLAMIA